MKVTVLGTSAAFAGKNEGCSSYLFSCGGKNYLIDAGPGCVSMLQNYISYKDLDAIFISHLHADHVSDIYTLRYAIFVAQRDGLMEPAFPIYMPTSPNDTFKFIRSNIEEEFSITEIKERLELNLNGLRVRFLSTDHSVLAFAMRFEYRKCTMVYTTDTGFFDDLVPFCSGADILLSEATLQERDVELASLGHMTARIAGDLAKQAGVKKLVLTHLWPEYDKSISLQEAKDTFSGEIVVAERGLVLPLSFGDSV
jgi:ribonuclease BN (tRNA processing enzyme)